MTRPDSAATLLRSLASLAGPFPPLDMAALPATPQAAFLAWLDDAIAAGSPEPHAMVLSTADAKGAPDARMLILKNLDARGWHFAASALSPKGRQVAANPAVALTFYWPKLGRQVRVRGRAVALAPSACQHDFRERSAQARAIALTERQSQPLEGPEPLAAALAAARARLEAEPGLTSEAWHVHVVEPATVEFWRGAQDRMHQRLLYTRQPAGDWARQALWP